MRRDSPTLDCSDRDGEGAEMSPNELEALKNENQLLRLRISALEDQAESLKRQINNPTFLEDLGLADEHYFTRRLEEAVLSARRYARFVSIVLVDLSPETRNIQSGNRTLELAARFREEFRKTDLIAYQEAGKIFILLEEADPTQAIQALRRVTREMEEVRQPNYALASFPTDSSRKEDLLHVLENRSQTVRRRLDEAPLVNTGEGVLSLVN